MTLYDQTERLFQKNDEVLLSDFEAGLTPSEALQFLISENTYVKRKVDGKVYVGHFHHRPQGDETLKILAKERIEFGFQNSQTYDAIRSPNVVVEYVSGGGMVSLRRAAMSEIDGLHEFVKKYVTPE